MNTTQPNKPGSDRLVRPRAGRALAGVAAGLGRRFDVNPWWFRIGFVVLAFFGGAGVILYLTGWVLMPEVGAERSIATRWLERLDVDQPATIVGAVLIGIAVIFLLAGTSFVPGRLIIAAMLLIAGVLLYRGDLGGGRGDHEPPEGKGDEAGEEEAAHHDDADVDGDEVVGVASADDVPASDAGLGAAASSGDDEGPPGAATIETTDPAPARKPRPRSILGRATFAVALIALGSLAAIDLLGLVDPRAVDYFGLALAIVGLGLVVGTFAGRARWLIAVGLVMTPLVLFVSVLPVSFRGDVGERTISVTSIAAVEDHYRLAAGSLIVDLGRLDVPEGEVVVVEAEVGVGELIVRLPRDEGARIDGSIGLGSLELLGREWAGFGIDRTVEVTGSGTIDLTVRGGVGSVTVERVGR